MLGKIRAPTNRLKTIATLEKRMIAAPKECSLGELILSFMEEAEGTLPKW